MKQDKSVPKQTGSLRKQTEKALAARGGTVQRKRSEAMIGKSHDDLETAVEERTKELQSIIALQKLTEEALKRSEAIYRIVADNTYDWEFWLSPEETLLYVSPSCKRITGYDAKEFLGNEGLFARIVHSDDRPLFDTHLKKEKKGNSSGEIEFRIIRKDGNIRWVGHVCQPVFDDEMRFLGIRGSNRDITRQKQAEEEIARFASFPQLNPGPVLEVDSSGKIIFYNNASASVLKKCNLSADVSVFLPEDIKEILADLKQKKERQCNRDLIIKDKIFAETIHFAPQFDTARIYAVDITERKQVEEFLRKERDFSSAVLNTAGAMVVVLDKEGCISRFNRECEQVTGYTSSEVLGRVFWEFLIPKDDLEGVRRAWKALMAGDFPLRHENHWISKNGVQHLIAWSNTAITGPDSQVEYIIGTGKDVTNLRLAETALRQSREDLNRAQAVGNIGSWRLDVRRNELLWSDENWRIFGVPQNTALTYETFLSTVHPDDRAHVDKKWKAALRGEPYDIEHRIVVKGQVKWVREKAEIEFDKDGNLKGGFGTTQDITEKKQAERDLQTLMEELKRSNSDLEQFAYAASHDLQEPLRVVAGFVSLLEKKYKEKLDEKAHEYIGYAIDGVKRMQVLIKDLLAYSQVGTKGKTFKPTICSVALEQAIFNLHAAIEESNAEITYTSLPTVSADTSQLTRLFQNLIGNAIKFQGDERLTIHIASEQKGNERVFSIRDNGIGIDPKFFDRIFVIFQRLHTREEYEGTGIGLAVCKKIVERHGGRIWVESEQGKGTTFYFTMPVME